MNGTIVIMLLIMNLPLLLILYFVMRSNAKPKKNIILGVTIPYEHKNDAAVQQICKDYLRAVNITVLGLMLLSLVSLIPKHFSVGMLVLMTVLTLTVILQAIPHIVYYKKLKNLKQEMGWRGSQNTVVDMAAAGADKRLPHAAWFAIPFAVAAVPLADILIRRGELMEALLYGINLLCILLFTGIYLLMKRQRGETVSENYSLNAALTRVRRRSWAVAWLAFSAATALFSLGLWCFGQRPLPSLVLIFVYAIVIIAVGLYTEMKTRRMQYKLTAGKTGNVLVDEDDQWILGMFYYNPNDLHTMKNERIGVGMTMNMAKLSGKIVMGFSLLLILLLPFTGVWMMAEEFTPMTLAIEGDALVSAHLREEYRVRLSDVEEVVLLEELPRLSRVVGTGMDTVAKGLFQVEGYGRCEVCLNPKEGPYLVVKTPLKIYLLGAANSGQMEEIYDELQGVQ